MPLSLIAASAFEFEQKVSCIVLSSLSIFLSSKTSVVTNIKAFNSVNKSISLFLIADSVSLSCISGLKEFKISIL